MTQRTTAAADASPAFTQRREFWVLLAYAAALGVLGALVGLVFLGVVDFGSGWYDPTDSGWFGGSWWWVGVTAAAGLLVGALHRVMKLPDKTPGVIEDLTTGQADPAFVPGIFVTSAVSLIGGASLGPEKALGSTVGGVGAWVSRRRGLTDDQIRTNTFSGFAGAYGGLLSSPLIVVALILELAHHVGDHAAAVRAGDWSRCPDFSFWDSPLVELEGLTLGIVGFGRIGRAVADVARVFGLRMLASGRADLTDLPADVRAVDLETLFRESDIVSLHCPLTEGTRHLVNRERLGLMKPSAWLINTSRGPLVDEAALAEALNEGRIGGAAVDVLSVEPPAANNPLLQAKHCIVTPHLAWATLAARRRLLDVAVENIRSFLQGRPVNVVNR